MESKFIPKPLAYSGAELRGHYIYKEHGLLGDAIIAFVGPCSVEGEMVDWVDRKSGAYIQSPKMLHFLVEHFGISLAEGVWRLRHLIMILEEGVHAEKKKPILIRKGNDLYLGRRKLSVAIATASGTSVVMHFGVNIEIKGTPVPTVGLRELRISPAHLARTVMKEYIAEVARMHMEAAKVRGVAEVL